MQTIEARYHRPINSSSCRPGLARLAGFAAVFAFALGCIAQEAKAPEAPSQTAEMKVPPPNDSKPQKGAAGESDRKKQITDESAQLLNMALALKAEVDKTTKDTLSLNVIKKADEIEKLAKSVKEKMKNSGS
jgi:hypothetical protein